MDPIIPEDILLAITLLLIVVVPVVVLAGAGAKIAQRRQRLVEPETHGDDGGRPTASEMQRATRRPTANEVQRDTARLKTGYGGVGFCSGTQECERRSAIFKPETHGDQGGHPMAGQQIIAGLEDAVAHARGETGRAKVTQYDDGGRPIPAPADYSDEVTDEHFKRIRQLVDQDEFDDWASSPRKAGDMRPERDD